MRTFCPSCVCSVYCSESRLVSPVISSLLGCGVSICGKIATTDTIKVVLRHEDYQVLYPTSIVVL